MMRFGLDRRGFVKILGLCGGLGLVALAPTHGRAEEIHGRQFVQQVNHAELYMTHYAFFEEPDPGVPPGVYIDAATMSVTNELTLDAPLESFGFTKKHHHHYVATSSAPVKTLPYVVSPPGFPPQQTPPEVLGAISATLNGAVPASVIAANTGIFLVAIGQFVPNSTAIDATLDHDGRFSVTRDTEFQVSVRIGFLFQPPAGVPAPNVGILTGWLTRGLVDELIGQTPGATANDLVVYGWRTTMTLSTENDYIRSTATEPPPVADGFAPGLTAVSLLGSRVDEDGNYTIVGHGTHVPFQSVPELDIFLFGVPVLTDVEFAVEETGVLLPVHDHGDDDEDDD
jgi:hypothetical protein